MLSKKNTPKKYPISVDILAWFMLFDEYKETGLGRVEMVNIGESRGMLKSLGEKHHYRWVAYHHYYGDKPAKPAKPVIQKNNEQAMLLDAYKAVEESEVAYSLIAGKMPIVAEYALRKLQRDNLHLKTLIDKIK